MTANRLVNIDDDDAGANSRLADGAVVARILALRAAALEDDATDAARVVATWWKSPLPLGDSVVALDGNLHLDDGDDAVFVLEVDVTIKVCAECAAANGRVVGADVVCAGAGADGS